MKSKKIKNKLPVIITYTHRNNWGSSSPLFQDNSSIDPEFVSHRPPSQEKRRLMMLAQGSEPSFSCFACGVRFKMEYGRYGHLKIPAFSPDTYWCKDCADLNDIVRIQ